MFVAKTHGARRPPEACAREAALKPDVAPTFLPAKAHRPVSHVRRNSGQAVIRPSREERRCRHPRTPFRDNDPHCRPLKVYFRSDDPGVEGLRSTLGRQAGLLTFGSAGDCRRESLWDNFRVARDTLRGAQDEDLPQACESYNLGLGSQQAITPEKSATLP